MARCHRIGQTQQVQVYRLITNNTYEKGMFERSCQKLGLDQALLGSGGGDKGGDKGPSGAEVVDLLKYGAYNIMQEDEESEAARRKFCEADIDELLAQGHKLQHGGASGAGGAFSKATFSSEGAAGEHKVDLHDPEFWSKLMPGARAAAAGGGLERAARRRPTRERMVEGEGSEDDETNDRGWKRRTEVCRPPRPRHAASPLALPTYTRDARRRPLLPLPAEPGGPLVPRAPPPPLAASAPHACLPPPPPPPGRPRRGGLGGGRAERGGGGARAQGEGREGGEGR
jgi:hypothetical protein